MILNCHYCAIKTKLVDGLVIYPHRQDLSSKYFYLCPKCKAYCGTHPGTNKPLGTVANAKTRKLRNVAHYHFDKLWKEKYFQTRKDAYKWLSSKLELKIAETHIAMFDDETLQKVINLSKRIKQTMTTDFTYEADSYDEFRETF